MAAVKTWRLAVGPFVVSTTVSLSIPLMRLGDLSGMLSGWDGGRFLALADHGYPSHLDPNDAFFPGYPLLVWAVSLATHNAIIAAVLVSLAASFVAMFYVAAIARRELPESVAGLAVWAVAVFPTAIFLAAAYSDSCFMATSAAALYYARSGKPGRAAVAAMLAGSFRIFGLALVPALAWECYRQRASLRGWALLALAPLGTLAYAAYLYLHTGDALAFAHAELLPAFGLAPVWPWQGAARSLSIAFSPTDWRRAIYAGALVFGIGGALLTATAWAVRKFPRSFAIYATAAVTLSLSVSSWRSAGRYDLALFPLALLLGYAALRWRMLPRAVVVLGGVGLAVTASTWATGAWVG